MPLIKFRFRREKKKRPASIETKSASIGTLATSPSLADASQKDNLQEDNLQEDNLQEDILQEDSLQEDNLQEDNLQEDPPQEDPPKNDHLQEDPLQKDPLQKDPSQIHELTQRLPSKISLQKRCSSLSTRYVFDIRGNDKYATAQDDCDSQTNIRSLRGSPSIIPEDDDETDLSETTGQLSILKGNIVLDECDVSAVSSLSGTSTISYSTASVMTEPEFCRCVGKFSDLDDELSSFGKTIYEENYSDRQGCVILSGCF
uniref:Uncharacterized protein n=1 Tax=Ditylum brightwellii TaxID=49249 RepID=A0A7S4T6F1_9STRA